jgi:hypothetical protein
MLLCWQKAGGSQERPSFLPSAYRLLLTATAFCILLILVAENEPKASTPAKTTATLFLMVVIMLLEGYAA